MTENVSAPHYAVRAEIRSQITAKKKKVLELMIVYCQPWVGHKTESGEK